MHDRVDEAMAVADRAAFLPPALKDDASVDAPLPIGHEQTCSQPSTVAAMLRLLDVPVGAHVLDVGSGSGWTTAILARLVGPTGHVLGVERVRALVRSGAAHLETQDVPWARIEPTTPGVLGRPRHGGWDRILVSADARLLPDDLVEQVASPGVLVIPVRGQMTRVVRDAAGRTTTSAHGAYRFVPLLDP